MARPSLSHLRHSTFLIVSSFGLLTSSFSCITQPKLDGMTPTDAQKVAIGAVRTAESNRNLELDVFDTQQTPEGDYAVYLQSRTTTTTADHWRVLVHPDRSAEVIPADPPLLTPETLRAYPGPLRPDPRLVTPPPPEPYLTGPRE